MYWALISIHSSFLEHDLISRLQNWKVYFSVNSLPIKFCPLVFLLRLYKLLSLLFILACRRLHMFGTFPLILSQCQLVGVAQLRAKSGANPSWSSEVVSSSMGCTSGFNSWVRCLSIHNWPLSKMASVSVTVWVTKMKMVDYTWQELDQPSSKLKNMEEPSEVNEMQM